MLMIVACWYQKGAMLIYVSNFSTLLKLAGDNKLSVNMSKTKEIVFHRPSQEMISHQLKFQALKGL